MTGRLCEMRILALDAATKTGFAIAENSKIYESGVQDFSKKRGESNGMMFIRFRKWLRNIIETTQPDVVVYERAHFRGGAATELCVGLQTRIQEVCEELRINYDAVHTATIKRYATGKGSAKKADIMNWAEKILRRPPIDDNEADAVAMACWAWDEFESEKL